jgi:hypothetical protein
MTWDESPRRGFRQSSHVVKGIEQREDVLATILDVDQARHSGHRFPMVQPAAGIGGAPGDRVYLGANAI